MAQRHCSSRHTQGHLDVVRHLVGVGAHKDQSEERWRNTIVHRSTKQGHLDVVRHLVEVGAHKDQGKNDGATPLFIAAQQGHLEVVCDLVEVGAHKDQATNDGATPLFIGSTRRPS